MKRKRDKIKHPESIEVRGCQFVLAGAPMSWSENSHGELRCNKCAQPLVVLFAARENPEVTAENPRWWVPTALTCSCLAPRSVAGNFKPDRTSSPRERKLLMKRTRYIYKWVRHQDQTLYDVGILEDGNLHNPRGYPSEIVRSAVESANARWKERCSSAAKKAAVTRAKRREWRVGETARRIVAGQKIGDRSHCMICGRFLTDPASIERGIGSECWQDVLAEIERHRHS